MTSKKKPRVIPYIPPKTEKRGSPGRSLQQGFYQDFPDEEVYFDEFQRIAKEVGVLGRSDISERSKGITLDENTYEHPKQKMQTEENVKEEFQDETNERNGFERDEYLSSRNSGIGAWKARQKIVDIFSDSTSPRKSELSSIIISNPQFKIPGRADDALFLNFEDNLRRSKEEAGIRHLYNFADVLLDNPAMYDFVMDGLRDACFAAYNKHISEDLRKKIPPFIESFYILRKKSRELTEELAYLQEECSIIESSYEKAFSATRQIFNENNDSNHRSCLESRVTLD